MVAVNLVIVAGNLTRDPQLRQAGGSQVCNFGVAVNNSYKAADGSRKEETTFVEVEAWGRTGEVAAQYLTKGRPVLVEGRLTQSTYEDKNGAKVTKTRVRADSVQFLGGPQDRAERNAQLAPEPAKQPAAAAAGTDEPPF